MLSDVPLTAPAYAQEIFGPVAPVVAFSNLDEAVSLANSTEYGLSLGILTRDVIKGLELAERIPRKPRAKCNRTSSWLSELGGRDIRPLQSGPIAAAHQVCSP